MSVQRCGGGQQRATHGRLVRVEAAAEEGVFVEGHQSRSLTRKEPKSTQFYAKLIVIKCFSLIFTVCFGEKYIGCDPGQLSVVV